MLQDNQSPLYYRLSQTLCIEWIGHLTRKDLSVSQHQKDNLEMYFCCTQTLLYKVDNNWPDWNWLFYY